MFKKSLAPATRLVLELLKNTKIASGFYMAGGTALALQLGHRQSIDLDFFSRKKFLCNILKRELEKLGKVKVKSEDVDTLHIDLSAVAVSFLYYPYKLLYKKKNYNNIYLADWRDIACMKLSAVSSRGSKKDFIDLHFILQKISFEELIKIFSKKHKNLEYNLQHILKSLVYFEDADNEPMPKMLGEASWPQVKNEMKKTVMKYV
ncbi:MAG: nucleotidyl transferase AbiEii/AbiGii toxin family protein [Candidatus Kuenenbacteria bacterium]